MPISASRWARYAAFVSMICPRRSSVPTETISARMREVQLRDQLRGQISADAQDFATRANSPRRNLQAAPRICGSRRGEDSVPYLPLPLRMQQLAVHSKRDRVHVTDADTQALLRVPDRRVASLYKPLEYFRSIRDDVKPTGSRSD